MIRLVGLDIGCASALSFGRAYRGLWGLYSLSIIMDFWCFEWYTPQIGNEIFTRVLLTSAVQNVEILGAFQKTNTVMSKGL